MAQGGEGRRMQWRAHGDYPAPEGSKSLLSYLGCHPFVLSLSPLLPAQSDGGDRAPALRVQSRVEGMGSREKSRGTWGPGANRASITCSLSQHIADPRAAPTDVKIRVLNSTAISLQWNRVYSDTVQGQLREYRVRKPALSPPNHLLHNQGKG